MARVSINLKRKRPLSEREIQANRAALAAKIAQMEPGRAIVAPPHCFDLKEIGAVAGSTAHRAQRGPGRKVEMTAVKAKANGHPAAAPAPARPKLSDEQIKEIHKEFRSGKEKMAAVAARHGMSNKELAMRFDLLELEYGRRRRPTDEDVFQAHQKYQEGAPLRVVATQLKIDPATLSSRFKRLGLEVRPAHRGRKPDVIAKQLTGTAEPVIKQEAEPPAWLRVTAGQAEDLELITPPPAEAGAGVITQAAKMPGLAEVLAFLEQVQQMGLPVTVSGRVKLSVEVEL